MIKVKKYSEIPKNFTGEAQFYGTGRIIWYKDGKVHRTDGPAVVDVDRQEWWVNGKRHRTDGPALVDGDYKAWLKDGKLHRTDGPAIENGDYKEWWVNDSELNETEYNKMAKKTILDLI